MERNIFTVHATIVNDQEVYSKISGFPKEFDSADYADETHPAPVGNPEKALRRAKAAAYTQLGLNYAVDNRLMQNVYIVQADGRTIFRETEGNFNVPAPEPTPNEEVVEEPETPTEGE